MHRRRWHYKARGRGRSVLPPCKSRAREGVSDIDAAGAAKRINGFGAGATTAASALAEFIVTVGMEAARAAEANWDCANKSTSLPSAGLPRPACVCLSHVHHHHPPLNNT